MACANGQIQIGINPDTMQPICIDQASYDAMQQAGNTQTGGTKNPGGVWWSQLINSVPGLLGGIADIIGAKKGTNNQGSVTVIQGPAPAEQKPFPWVFVVIGLVVFFVIIIVVVAKKNKDG